MFAMLYIGLLNMAKIYEKQDRKINSIKNS